MAEQIPVVVVSSKDVVYDIVEMLKPTVKIARRNERKSFVVGLLVGYLFLPGLVKGTARALAKTFPEEERNDGFTR